MKISDGLFLKALISGAVALVLQVEAALNFTDVSAAAGITETYMQEEAGLISMDREYASQTGGAVAEDFNGDGWVDLFVLRGGLSPNLLYINQGDGTFVDEAVERGAGQTGRYSAACGADYDSDGDVDLFVVGVDVPHLLLTNDGDGNFVADGESIPRLGVHATSPSWADVDGDGLLDLAIGGWSGMAELDAIRVYRNRGVEGFALFQLIPSQWTFVPHFADLNGDGFVDLVAVADFGNTRYFFNNGRGVFLPAGGNDIQNGMGVATSDLDHDGDLDLFMTAIQHPVEELHTLNTNGNRLLLNDGHGEFTDVTSEAGVRAGYWGWGAVMADLDHDGDDDIFHVNGFLASSARQESFESTPAVLFENQGGMSFVEVAGSSGDAGDGGQGRCVVSFDFDNDGDLDLFIANNNDVVPDENGPGLTVLPGRFVLLRNDSQPKGTWLKVRVAGAGPHHAHGVGARVTASLAGKSRMRELNASSSFNGHGPQRIAHFGMGDASVYETVTVSFPNGDSVVVEEVTANQELVVESPFGVPEARDVESGGALVFDLPGDAIPSGGLAVWTAGGVEYANPATIVFSNPMGSTGTQQVTLQIYGDNNRVNSVRTETFEIKVRNPAGDSRSIARIWNEAALDAIRIDFPNPGIHARNLFHLSVVMWDAWTAFDPVGLGYLHREFVAVEDPAASRREAMSYAAYRLLSSRYTRAVHASASQLRLDFLMKDLGYPIGETSLEGDSPAALGNRIAATVIAWSETDGSLEENNYHNPEYRPVNRPLVLAESGTTMVDPNRWQPLQFEIALSQNGLFTLPTQIYAGSHWGRVRPFALRERAAVYLDPGAPPRYGGGDSADYFEEALEVIRYSGRLDPDDRVILDISPRSRGLNQVGLNDGIGHGDRANPVTGMPYEEQRVKRADYGRVIAEYWADGPDSETPPGHWNTLANEVSDHPELQRRFRGAGQEMDRLEWDVKLYFALNGALHDAAVAAWDCKRYYDYVRPISAIRFLSGTGELPEVPGLVEKITETSSAMGERHEILVAEGASLGETAILAWAGEPDDPVAEYSGSRWIRGEDWLPYQRSTFVTPAFAGYVSGHSTFSRAAAEVLADFTGSEYFPGGLGERLVPAGSLEFEYGPSDDVTLQWATYYDAADEAGLSRLYGGIHFPVDDGQGRVMGSVAGKQAMAMAGRYFDGSIARAGIKAILEKVGPRYEIRGENLVRGFYYHVQGSRDLMNWENLGLARPALDSRLLFQFDSSLGYRFLRLTADR